MIKPVIDRARNLRASQSETERLFWARVRDRRLGGLKFKRQVPIGPYFADFLCEEAMLVVELDGGQHTEERALAHDAARDEFLRRHGYEVFRVWNADFRRDPVAALDHVLYEAQLRLAMLRRR